MIRRIGLILVWAMALVGFLLAGAFALAQTGVGQRLIAEQLGRALSRAGTTVRAEGLAGLIPFDFRLERLRMADAEGPWLELEDLRLSASPLALLRGRLEIDELTARRLALHRLPPDEGSGGTERFPELPTSVPRVIVRSLNFDRLELGQAVLGEPAVFSLSGGLRTGAAGRTVDLTLDLDRTDEDTARASLEARLNLAERTLALDADAAETGGLLAGLTGRAGAGAFALQLKGAGPLEDWHGKLRVEAEGLAHADAEIALAVDDTTRMHFEGALAPAPGVLPAPAAALIGDRLHLALTAVRTGPDLVTIENLHAMAALVALNGSGRVDLVAERVAAQANLEMSDLAPLGEALATPLAGTLDLSAQVDGALMQPEGRLVLAATDLEAGAIHAREVRATLELAMLEQLSKPGARVRVSGEGQAQGVALPPDVALPPQEVVWQAALTAPLDGAGRLAVEQLTVTADHLALTAQGMFDATTLGGEAQVSLALDALAPFTEPHGQRVEGTAELEAKLALGAGALPVSIDLYGRLHELSGLPAGVGALLGPAPTLEANAIVVPDQAVEVTHVRVAGANATLEGMLDLGLPERTLHGALTLDLPRLAPLSPLLGVAVDGPLTARAELSGGLAAPAIELSADSPGLLVAGEHIDALAFTGSVAGTPEAADGQLRLAVTSREIEAELATGLELRAPILRATDLSLTAPRTKVEGHLGLDLEHRLVEGEITGRVDQLRAFAALLPVRFAGRVDFEARASAEDGAQTVALAVQSRDLASDFGRLRRLGLRGSVADALSDPRVTAELTLNGLDQGEIQLAQGSVRAEGTPEALSVTVSATGDAYAPFDLDSRIDVALGGQIQARVQELAGSFADQPVSLAAPTTVTIADGKFALSGLNLRLSDARLAGEFVLGPQEVAAEATLEQLPLVLLGRFGAPDLRGQLAGRLSLQGAANNPTGTIRTDLARRAPAFAEVPPADLSLAGALAARRLRLDLVAEGVTDRPVRANAELPLVVDLAAGAVEIPREGQVAGSLDAEVSLARLAEIVGLDDQRLEGPLFADLTAGGTVAEPTLDGTVRIDDALYENGTTGTVLRDLNLLVTASRQTIAIERFTATDGGEGRLSGDGTVELDAAADYPVSLRLQLDQARLVASDDITATTSGGVRLEGSAAAPAIRGEIEVDRADITIPERLGPGVAVIAVEEIGKNLDGAPPADGDSTASELVLALDLAVAMPGKVFVRGRGLESEWEGRLRVAGTTAQPRITGTLQVRRGSFELLGRRFDLRKGVIELAGQSPPVPALDIEAVARAEEITAVVRITGEATAPEFKLESEPPLPEDEVLSRLLFQRDASELGPADAVRLAAAINTLRGGGLGLLGQARQALGLDTIGVTGEGLDDGRVRAGKYLNDQVYLEVGKGAATDSEDVRLEVEILPNLSLDAGTDAEAQTGIGLKWRYDY